MVEKSIESGSYIFSRYSPNKPKDEKYLKSLELFHPIWFSNCTTLTPLQKNPEKKTAQKPSSSLVFFKHFSKNSIYQFKLSIVHVLFLQVNSYLDLILKFGSNY